MATTQCDDECAPASLAEQRGRFQRLGRVPIGRRCLDPRRGDEVILHHCTTARDACWPICTSSRRSCQMAPGDLDERQVVADLRHHAWAGKIDVVHGLDRRGAGGQDDDLVGQCDRLLEVVGHEHDRGAGSGPEVEQLVLHHCARLHVEGAERFVQQQDLGLVDEGLRQRHALCASRPTAGADSAARTSTARPARPIHVRFLFGHGPRQAAVPGAGCDVVEHAAPREQGIALKHEADPAIDVHHRAAHHLDLAGARPDQARHEIECGGFSASRGPDDADEFTPLDREAEVAHGGVELAAGRQEAPRHAVDLDGGGESGPTLT